MRVQQTNTPVECVVFERQISRETRIWRGVQSRNYIAVTRFMKQYLRTGHVLLLPTWPWDFGQPRTTAPNNPKNRSALFEARADSVPIP